LYDKSENYSVLGNENGVCLLQEKNVGVQPFLAANKKKELKAKIKTLQENDIAYEAIKI
jgi:hypothetical protein